MKEQIFRWKNEGDIYEYRFTNGVCDGFFTNGNETHTHKNYKNRHLTEIWKSSLPKAGFIEEKQSN